MYTFAQKTKPTQKSASILTNIPVQENAPNLDGFPSSQVGFNEGNLTNGMRGSVCHDFSQVPVCGKALTTIQRQPRVNTPGDVYEKEADRIADQVMRMPDPQIQRQVSESDEEKEPRPNLSGNIQRQCVGCEGEEMVVQAKVISGQSPQIDPNLAARVHSIKGGGQPLPNSTRAFFESRFGYDFSHVRVHTNPSAARVSHDLNARAFTLGSDVVFGAGNYSPNTAPGRRLLAHELTHVVQQSHAKVAHHSKGYDQLAIGQQTSHQVQRAVSYNVLDWDASRLGPPSPQNGPDPRTILIPSTGQILVSALVEMNGDASDPCTSHEVGTTQTAWSAWTIMNYRGRTAADGSVEVRHRAAMPMRDPAPAGNVWYDPANVRSPSFCGDAVSIFHRDSPWHNPPKARNNSAVSGNPLNYLHRYRRGLLLVTYLTARDSAGNFLRRPLRFIYWNSIQDFSFTPQYPTPTAAPFLAAWPFTGQIKVNIGAKGRGAVADAPYYTTGGPDYNSHFNTSGNWRVTERRGS